MIHIELAEPKDDELWTRWRQDCEDAVQALIRYHEHGEGDATEPRNDLYGRRSIKKKYYACKGKRIAPFHGKCVFCETAKEILHIEHFRPKGAVTDADGRRIEAIQEDGTSKPHTGYYWLTYDWRNLLLACDDCNIGYKKNRFPLEHEDTRAWKSDDDLGAERPMLVNPLGEDPSEHLTVDVATGLLEHKSMRGAQTIAILGLNREPLPELRRDVVRRIYLHWDKATSRLITEAEREQARAYLCDSKRGLYGFTLTARTVIEGLCEDSRFISKL